MSHANRMARFRARPMSTVLVAGLCLGTAACGGSTSGSTATTIQPVTSTSAPISAPGGGSTTLAPAGAEAACMVGDWDAQNVKISGHGGEFNGGVGAKWDIQAGGAETVDWSGSGPFSVAGQAEYSYRGQETAHVQITSGASGSWSATVLTDSRTALLPAAVAQATGKTSEAVPSTAGLVETGTWTCSPTAMTISVTVDGSSVDVALSRS